MPEDLPTTINRYKSQENNFVFSNQSSYEWFVFEYFMKVLFAQESIHLVIEGLVSTTDEVKNLFSTSYHDSLPSSPFSMRSPLPNHNEKTINKPSSIQDDDDEEEKAESNINTTRSRHDKESIKNLSPSKLRGGKIFLQEPSNRTLKKMLEPSTNTPNINKVNEPNVLRTPAQEREVQEGPLNTPKRVDKKREITMNKYRKELAKVLEMKGEERQYQIDLVKLLKEQLIIEGNFESPTQVNDELNSSNVEEKPFNYKGFETTQALRKKAMELMNKHIHVNVLGPIKGLFVTNDPNLIWQALVKRYRRNEIEVEAYIRQKIPEFFPLANQTLEEFMNAIEILYQIIYNIKGEKVSDEIKKENLRIILHKQRANTTSFQILRIQAYLNNDIAYDDILRTIIAIDSADRDFGVQTTTNNMLLRGHEKPNKDVSSKPYKERYKHINYADKAVTDNVKRYTQNYDPNKVSKQTEYTKGRNYPNKKKRYGRYNKGRYTYPDDRRYTPSFQQDNSRTSDERQQNKNQISVHNDIKEGVHYFEVMDGPDNTTQSVEHVNMLKGTTYESSNEEDENDSEDSKIGMKNDEIIASQPAPLFRPLSLKQQTDNIQRKMYEEIGIIIPITSQYRVIMEDVFSGFTRNDVRRSYTYEYNHTHDLDEYALSFTGHMVSDYDVAIAIVMHPYLRKVLYENRLPHEVRMRIELFSKTLMKRAVREIRSRIENKGTYLMSEYKTRQMTHVAVLNATRIKLEHQMDIISNYVLELVNDGDIYDPEDMDPDEYDETLRAHIYQFIGFVNDHAMLLTTDDYVLQDTMIPSHFAEVDAHNTKYGVKMPDKTSRYRPKGEEIADTIPSRYTILSPEEAERYKDNRRKAHHKMLFGNNSKSGYIASQRSIAKLVDKQNSNSRINNSLREDTGTNNPPDNTPPSHEKTDTPRRSKRNRGKKKREEKDKHNDHENIHLTNEIIAYTQKVDNDTDIIVDSGASIHMFRNPTLLFNIRKKFTRIKFGNGNYETYNMIGDASVLRDVVLTASASKNIMSVGKLTDIGYTMTIKENRAYIRDQHDNIVSTATKRGDGLLYLDDMNLVTPFTEECHLRSSEEVRGAAPNRLNKFHSNINPLNVLHNRFGHINEGLIKAMVSSGNVLGVEYTYDQIKKLHMDPCDACMRGKMTKLPAKATLQPGDYKPFEKMASDIVGKMNVISVQGNKYLILYIDYKTNFIIPYFVTRKSHLLNTFKDLYKEVTDKGHKITILQSDSESVFKDTKVEEWCQRHNIESHFSPAYFHEGNGKIERAIRTIVTAARTMMLANNAPANMWQYAITYAVKIHNRIPRQSLDMRTPYEVIFSHKPDISSFIPFYAKGWVLKYKEEKTRKGKFDSVSEPCHFIGLAPQSKNAFLVRLKDGRVLTRRDCQFDEHIMPPVGNPEAIDVFNIHGKTDHMNNSHASEGAQDTSDSSEEEIEEEDQHNNSDDDIDKDDNTVIDLSTHNQGHRITSEEKNNIKANRHQQSLRRASSRQNQVATRTSERLKQIPKYLQQYVYASEVTIDIPTPKSVKEALSPLNKHRNEWLKAIDKEMNEMWSRGSLVKVDIEEAKRNNRKPFKSKFVFKVKNEPDGSIRFKARLVGCGYSQIKGIDYTYTYAPTPGFHLVILILHISIINSWNIIANDIGNAYLEAQADTLLYMNLPKDYTQGIQQVVRLDGNINGTKQGALLWANVIDEVLLKFNCIRSKIEPCLYIYKNNKNIIYIIVYVDDILMTGNDNDELDKLQQHLAKSFKKVTNQGEVRKFLGVQIKRETINEVKYLTLHHHDYLTEKAKDITNIKNRNTPLPINLKQIKDDGNDKIEPIHDLVGQIRFLADRCRPDIAFAASFMARFSISATQQQINTCHRILQYLNITKHEGIRVGSKTKNIVLTAYADASFATEEDSKSQLCYALYLSEDSGTCMFKSWKDKSVSTSSTHAEIHALFDTIKTIMRIIERIKLHTIRTHSYLSR